MHIAYILGTVNVHFRVCYLSGLSKLLARKLWAYTIVIKGTVNLYSLFVLPDIQD